MKLDIKKLFASKSGAFILIGLIAGLALMLFPSEDSGAVTVESKSFSSVEFCALLEDKTRKLICELEGVDDCNVVITLETGFRYIYATDQHVGGDGDSKQTDKTIVLADGDSGESPILIEETMPKVAGVAVVCRGATYNTELSIIELLCAIFDIPSNRISVQT